MSEHAPLSPSGADLWMNCPGGAVLNRGVESPASYASAQGTVAHSIGYQLLTSGSCGLGPVKQDGFDIDVDSEMVSHANEYAKYVEALGGWQRYEQRVSLEWLVPGVWGTADAVVFNIEHRELHVVDLKYGAGNYVPVVGNWQLLIYALAALGPDNWLDVETVHMHIFQPRMNNIASWVLAVTELPDLRAKLDQAVQAVTEAQANPSEHLHPGTHCKWCPQRGTCKALQGHAVTAAQATFGAVETLPPATVGAILDQAEVIDLWISAVRAEAYRRAEHGECPGWKLVPKRATRQWAVDDARVGAASISSGVNVYGERPLLSPAQLEKTIGKRAYAEHFAPLVTSVSSGLKLVRASDPAPGVLPNQIAALRFGEVKETSLME